MKIKKGFMLKKEEGQYVVTCDKSVIKDFTTTIVLTEVSTFLWKMLADTGATKEEMLNAVLANYDISTVLALSNIDIFIKTLNENGILEV